MRYLRWILLSLLTFAGGWLSLQVQSEESTRAP